MTLFDLYLLATLALLTCIAFVPLILVTSIPLSAVYYHSLIRKPVVWILFLGSLSWEIWLYINTGEFLLEKTVPLALMALAVLVTYNFYPSVAFPAVDFPEMSNDPLLLPIEDKAQLAVIEYNGVTKAYPLDYVIHGHIINDKFGERLVSLTYCALCRSIIPFDVTDIGPLYVGAMKNGNMVVADRHTGTFFQQGTFESVIGPIHPKTLEMVPFQFLTWKQVKDLDEIPQICQVTKHDFREFELPIRGAWKKLTSGERTPGLTASNRDKTFPARTSVIGVNDPSISPKIVYVKNEVLEHSVVKNNAAELILVAQDDAVNAFRMKVQGQVIDLIITSDGVLKDEKSETVWDARGKYKTGIIDSDLEVITISDEYWYSWKLFHPRSELIRI